MGGENDAFAQGTQEINVNRYTGMGYGVTTATVDFTAAKAYLGVSDVTTDMLRVYNTSDELTDAYSGYDGWFNNNGQGENWGNNAYICVKFFQAIYNDGIFEICDMSGAGRTDVAIVGHSYTAKWILVVNDKTYTYNINVTFIAPGTPTQEISENIISGGSVEYSEVDPSYSEKTITLTSEVQTAIATELGIADISGVTDYFGYNPSTQTLLSNYAGYDGWRATNGDFANWSGTATVPICVKLNNGIDFLTYNIQGSTPGDYHAYWAFATDTKAVIVDFVVTITENTLIISDNIIAGGSTGYVSTDNSYTEKTIVLSAETQAAIATELGVADLSSATHYGYNPTTEKLVIDYAGYDGWRSTNGNFAIHTGTNEVPICVKINDGTNILVYNIQGSTPGDYHAYWAFATETNAVVVDFVVTITVPTIELWEEDEDISPLAQVDGYQANVLLDRTFYEGWNTLVLPFEMSIGDLANEVSDISEIGTFTSDELNGDHITIHFTKLDEVQGTLPAATPVLVYFASDAEASLSLSNVVINANNPVTNGTNFAFTGTYVQGELIQVGDYYLGSGDTFKKSSKVRTTKGFRAFFHPLNNEVKASAVTFEFDGEATAIDAIDGEEVNTLAGEWYTLAGQRISAPQAKGLYIKNGKKVMIK